MSHSVGEMKCRSQNAEHDFVVYNGAKSVTGNDVSDGELADGGFVG